MPMSIVIYNKFKYCLKSICCHYVECTHNLTLFSNCFIKSLTLNKLITFSQGLIFAGHRWSCMNMFPDNPLLYKSCIMHQH